MNQISVFHVDDLETSQLEIYWNDLYPRCNENIFLSWNWIGTWLKSVPFPYHTVIAKYENQIVGLCVLVTNKKHKKRFFTSTQLCLHRTGRSEYDQSWIEYNDFLVNKDNEQHIRLSIAEYIVQNMSWDELLIGVSERKTQTPFKLMGLIHETVWKSHSFTIDLQHLRENKCSFLESLSKNSRYAINRSLREYQTYGNITLTAAKNDEEALEWLYELMPLHISRWENTPTQSGFKNNKFLRFHETLIKEGEIGANIDLLKIKAGNLLIGYMYNLLQADEVKFYLSASNYLEPSQKLKPGLVSHHMAVNWYLSRGFKKYDLMAGESQYKRSLSSESFVMEVQKIQRNSLKVKVFDRLKKLKKNYFTQKHEIGQKEKNVRFILTGGTQGADGNSPQYINAKIVACEVDHNGKLTLLRNISYSPEHGMQHPNTNIIYKAGSLYKNHLNVCTESEIHTYNLPSLNLINQISHRSFNDLHHIVENEEVFKVVNTGQDCLTIISKSLKQIEHKPVTSNQHFCRVDTEKDYRQISSTKPHLIHPNYCFEIDNQTWVTRCDTMDAVCIDDPKKRICINGDLTHDGVIFRNHIFFTTVNGVIKVYNKKTLCQDGEYNLNDIVGDIKGWCRGILPLSHDNILVGISKFRKSNKKFDIKQSYAKVILISLKNQTKLWEINTSDIGVDAIFSILEYPKHH